MSRHAPIALFAYNRPAHTARAIASLKACPEAAASALFVFCDGPRKPEAAAAVAETRAVVRQATSSGFGDVTIIEQPVNRGLANSIIAGVTDLCRRFGRVIVVEDDLILSPFFLRFMNEALDRYEDDDRVMQVAGYMFDAELNGLEEDALFLPFVTSWGWATWDRAWRYFDPDMTAYDKIANSAPLRRAFDLNGNYPYFAMLTRQRMGQIDSWAIRWYLSTFIRNGLALYPRRSLVANAGMDGSGMHCSNREEDGNPVQMKRAVSSWPSEVTSSPYFSDIASSIGRTANNVLSEWHLKSIVKNMVRIMTSRVRIKR